MFDFLKDINKLRQMQESAKQLTLTKEKDGIKVTVNGGMEIIEVVLNPNLAVEDQAKAVRDTANAALKEIQVQVARQLYSGGS